jgi:hypothetical protein
MPTLRGEVLARYAKDWLLDLKDIFDFVREPTVALRRRSDRPSQPASANRLRQHGHSLSPPRRIAENALGCGSVMIARKASGARWA